jgi:WD40 repeat protein
MCRACCLCLLAACLVFSTQRPAHSQSGEARARLDVDSYGDPLPEAALARLGTVRLRHGDAGARIAFSKNGKQLASAGQDGITVWEVASGKRVQHIARHAVGTCPVAWSGNQRLLATGGEDKIIRLWDATTGAESGRLSGGFSVNRCVLFSADDTLLASCGDASTIGLWDVSTRQAKYLLAGHREQAARRPNNQQPDTAQIFSVAFSPDGMMLASACLQDKEILIWDVRTGTLQRSFDTAVLTFAVAFSPDGKTLASGGADKLIHRWDLSTGAQLASFKGDLEIYCLAYSPGGKLLAAGGTRKEITGQAENLVQLWDAASGRLAQRIAATASFSVNALAFSPDGRTLATASYDNLVRLWDPATGKERHPLREHEHAITAMALSPDGRLVVTGDALGVSYVWDTASGRKLRSLEGHIGPLQGLAFLPDSKRVMGIGPDYEDRIYLWDAVKVGEPRTLTANTRPMRFLALSPDGSIVALPNGDLLDVATGQTRGTFAQRIQVYRGCFSPDGKILAGAAMRDRTRSVRLWDVNTKKELRRLTGQTGVLHALAFSPDGRTLAGSSDDRRIILWEVATGNQRGSMTGHTSPVLALAFSPDGRTFASGSGEFFNSEDSSVRLWDLASGNQRRRLVGHQGGVTSVCYTPDSQRLFSSSRDTTLLVWDVREAPARVAGTPLSVAEIASHWDSLGGQDAQKAYRAIWALSRTPRQFLSFLQGQLEPVAPADAKKTGELIAELNSDRFATRQAATRELLRLGDLAEAALREALQKQPSAEARRRIETILHESSDVANQPGRLQALRAIEVLEKIGSVEARKVLRWLAEGAPDCLVTREARSTLVRLDK